VEFVLPASTGTVKVETVRGSARVGIKVNKGFKLPTAV
jgi:hypothetical protein